MGADNGQKPKANSKLLGYIQVLSSLFVALAGILKSFNDKNLVPLLIFGVVAIVIFILLDILIKNTENKLMKILAFTIPVIILSFVVLSVISLFFYKGPLCHFRNDVVTKIIPVIDIVKCDKAPIPNTLTREIPIPDSGLVKLYTFDLQNQIEEQLQNVNYVQNRFRTSNRAIRVVDRPAVFLDTQYTRAIKELFKGSFSLNFWLADASEASDGDTNYSIFYLTLENTPRPVGFWIYKERDKGKISIQFATDSSNDHLNNRILEIITLKDPNGAGDITWHNYTIVYDKDSGELEFYMENDDKSKYPNKLASMNISNLSQYIFNDAIISIGANSNTAASNRALWKGSMDNFAFYNRVLTLEEIKKISNNRP